MSCRPRQGWHAFLHVPVDGRKFLVMMKLSRWRGPDKLAGFVMLHLNCPDGVQKPRPNDLSESCPSDKLFGRAGMTTRASACNPIDFILAGGSVRVA